MKDLANGEQKKKNSNLKLKMKKIIMRELLFFIFIIFLKWKMKRKVWWFLLFYKKILLIFANINREIEDFDHMQVNRYEQTDDILLGWV